MSKPQPEKHIKHDGAVTIAIGKSRKETAWKNKEPYLDKEQMCQWVESFGIKRPRLYDLGFAHNNCGGFCVKAGLGHFYNLLKMMPERYAYHEQRQEDLFLVIGKRVPFLKRTRDKQIQYLSLKEFREEVEAGEKVDLLDVGGCGCFGDMN